MGLATEERLSPAAKGTPLVGTAPASPSAAAQLSTSSALTHHHVSIANDLDSGDRLYVGFDPAMTTTTAPFQFDPGFGDNIEIDNADKLYVLGGPTGTVTYRAAVL